MLEIDKIRKNRDEIVKGLEKRNIKSSLVDEVIELDIKRREAISKSEDYKREVNIISKKVGEAYKNNNKTKAEEFKKTVSDKKNLIKQCDTKIKNIIQEINSVLYNIPNVPNKEVPKGKSEKDNVVVEEFNIDLIDNNKTDFHWDIAEKLDIIDFKTGVKITGSGFPVFKKKGARLVRALVNFFLDNAIYEGYREYHPPYLVNEKSGFGTGQLPDKEGQMYHTERDGFYLIPTSEVPLTNIYRDYIAQEKELPIKCTAHSPCFRREAGSYGKDVRGLNRVHQFDKVEIVQITKPENSYKTLNEMVNYVKKLLAILNLPFRVIKLCSADLGFTSALTYDFEVYSPAQKKWLEVSSVSNFETFQSNRLKLRYKTESGEVKLLHTLNGSALALPRVIASILENNYNNEEVLIPKPLVHYTGFEKISLN